MSTDPTANPPEDRPSSSSASDPTQPTFGSASTPTPPSPPPAASTPPPPPPAYGGPPAPGQPYPGYGPAAAPPPAPAYQGGMYVGSEHPQGTLILILGIVSIVLCQLTGPFAWVMGRKALTEIDASGRPYGNRGTVQAGMICGIIGTAFLALGLLWLVFVLVIGIGAASSGR